jgi:hypothetical protein
MNAKTRLALLGYGLSTSLIEKIAQRDHTLGALRELNRAALLGQYEPAEVDEIKSKLQRVQIPEGTINELLRQCDGVCCYCGDGNNVRPFQIHHIIPYSRTQDNSDANLLVICPTHHVSIHENRISFESQRSQRRRWVSVVELAQQFRDKGLQFPFGLFQSLDYSRSANPAELVQLAPLSPSTTLICYSPELAARADTSLERDPLLILFGGSGSGKTTFAVAVGARQQERGFRPFLYRLGKSNEEPLKQVFLLLSVAVRPTFVILDDANLWATATDLKHLWKAVCDQTVVRILLTWTDDGADDTSKIRASPISKLQLVWSDLKPAVVSALLENEADVVRELQRHEPDHSIGSLGLGSLHSSLSSRIRAVGERPQSVYEFIFGLRGDVRALSEDVAELANNDRSDVPVLYAAIEQIADFERPVSVTETVAACNRVEKDTQLPAASTAWVTTVFEREVRNRRMIRMRDSFTTIHRRWAARLISAALTSKIVAPIAEDLLRPSFDAQSAPPERLLRLWSWLRSLTGSRHFTKKWASSLQQNDWNVLAKRCAESDLSLLGAFASITHLLFGGNKWTQTLGAAFKINTKEIAAALYKSSEQDWYSLCEIAMAIGHAAPEAFARIVQGWDAKSVAETLLRTEPEEFHNVTWLLSSITNVVPEWLPTVGEHLDWERYKDVFNRVKKGDVESLAACFEVFRRLRGKLYRSMLRSFSAALKKVLTNVSLGDLRLSPVDTDVMLLTIFFLMMRGPRLKLSMRRNSEMN